MIRKFLGVVLASLVLGVIAKPAEAQASNWCINPEQSAARLFVPSPFDSRVGVNVGVARVSGSVSSTSGDLQDLSVNFTLVPAYVQKSTGTSGSCDGGETIPEAAGVLTVSFRSAGAVQIASGAVRVPGELTWTYLERSVSYDANEGYSGPVYGEPVVHTWSQPVSFDFTASNVASLQSLFAANSSLRGVIAVPAASAPEMKRAIAAPDWPSYVADERCEMPATIGEGFSGPSCTGENVRLDSRADVHCVMPATIGEDFAGEVCAPVAAPASSGLAAPAGTSLRLDLHFAGSAPAAPAATAP